MEAAGIEPGGRLPFYTGKQDMFRIARGAGSGLAADQLSLRKFARL
jgi:hypothetical protein